MIKKLDILGSRIDNLSMDETLALCKQRILDKEQLLVFTPNTEIIMMCYKDEEFRNLINSSDINIPDGVGLILGSKLKKKKLKEKVAGFELSMNLIEEANLKHLKLYIVAGKPGVAETACENIRKKYSNVDIVGCQNGYFKGSHLGIENSAEELAIIEDINDKQPDILFVGLGAKKQELWAYKNAKRINAKIIIGNGGTTDVIAGNVKRAPDFFVRCGLEWLYRLINQPSRIKRQILLPQFLLKIIFGGKDTIKIIE